jgi:uncharacterized protein
MPELKLGVTVAYSPAAREVCEIALTLDAGSTVADALKTSVLAERFPELASTQPAVGVWNRKAELSQPLAEGDRVEVYRPLKVDPKVARRQRFQKQGAKTAGLFANKRPGSKSGY